MDFPGLISWSKPFSLSLPQKETRSSNFWLLGLLRQPLIETLVKPLCLMQTVQWLPLFVMASWRLKNIKYSLDKVHHYERENSYTIGVMVIG